MEVFEFGFSHVQELLDACRVGEEYSLTRVYWVVRKSYGLSRDDASIRRLRPYRWGRRQRGVERRRGQFWTPDVVVARRYAITLLTHIQDTHSKDGVNLVEVPQHSGAELRSIFWQIYRDLPEAERSFTQALRLLGVLFHKSWLAGDWRYKDIVKIEGVYHVPVWVWHLVEGMGEGADEVLANWEVVVGYDFELSSGGGGLFV